MKAYYVAAAAAIGVAAVAGPLIAWQWSMFSSGLPIIAPLPVVSPANASVASASKPAPSAVAEAAGMAESRPGFDVVRVESSGAAVVAGHAAANVGIELRDDGKVVATAKADETGQFVILPTAFSVGGHHLALTARSANGTATLSSNIVAIDVSTPSAKTPTSAVLSGVAKDGVTVATSSPSTSQPPPKVAAAAISAAIIAKEVMKAKVVRGDSLWSISAHLLGAGEHYPQISAANGAQIRNPSLIYPGQLLVVPQVALAPNTNGR